MAVQQSRVVLGIDITTGAPTLFSRALASDTPGGNIGAISAALSVLLAIFRTRRDMFCEA